jgi:uncharacterized protein YjaZ
MWMQIILLLHKFFKKKWTIFQEGLRKDSHKKEQIHLKGQSLFFFHVKNTFKKEDLSPKKNI